MKIEQLLEQGAPSDMLMLLYRGVQTGNAKKGSIFNASVRQDRRPSDTDTYDSALFNYGIELKFGISEIRKRAVFASTSIATARHYAVMGMEHDKKARVNGVVQLKLAPSATIVFNPNISDSLELFEGGVSVEHPLAALLRMLKDHMNVHEGAYWKITNDAVANSDYLGKSATQFFMEVFERADINERHVANLEDTKTQYMNNIREYATALVDGYQVSTAGNLDITGDVECIIANLTSYSGKVLDRV